MARKWVYLFTEGNANMRELLGGKGANLAEMTNLGLPVPQGFTITTEACTQYYEDGKVINDEISSQISEYMRKLEEITGKKFGDKENPLLVSVRSGARASMPGMMDTILNLGLNEDVVESLSAQSGNPRWAWDCYRRFIQMFSDVVMEVSKSEFEKLIDKKKVERGVTQDVDLTAEDLKDLADQFKAMYKKTIGKDFPTDPKVQLIEAVKAVFRSWDNPRANVYRRDNDIPYSWGTAVNVQMMAFGNMGDDSGSGVAFTRNPATGENKFYAEILMNAQGEDVVSGVRTPMEIDEIKKTLPDIYKQLTSIAKKLEDHYHDMQDMEFTIEHGKLYMLQTRNGKRTARAALKIANDLVKEGKIDKKTAVLAIDPRNLDTLLHGSFDKAALKSAELIGKGLPAAPGAASGKIVFTAEDSKEWAAKGEKVVLVRLETSPEDIEGMKSAQGKAVSRMAVLPAFFGVDEPAYFGMPMILNPMFLIPWVIGAPTISVFGTHLLKIVGLLPFSNGTGGQTAANLPFFMGNLMNYGMAGLIWGCVLFVLIVLMYVPFVKAYDKQLLDAEAANAQE